MRRSSEKAEYRVFPALGVDLLQARFQTHRYARHSHDTYAIGLTQEGVQSFWCRGEERHGLPGMVLTINPDEAHDGHSGTPEGYAYSIFYLKPATVRAALEDFRDRSTGMPVFVAPLLADAALAHGARRLLKSLTASSDQLEQEAALHALLWTLFAAYIENASATAAPPAPSRALQRVRDFLHENFRSRVSLAELSAIAGMSRFRLNAGFRNAFGLPPHAYMMRLRLQAARAMIESGQPVAHVAAELGFVDQSHLTHHFKAWFGVTPGAFGRAGTRIYNPARH